MDSRENIYCPGIGSSGFMLFYIRGLRISLW